MVAVVVGVVVAVAVVVGVGVVVGVVVGVAVAVVVGVVVVVVVGVGVVVVVVVGVVMSFNSREEAENNLWAGVDAPKPSNARIMLDYYKMMDMTPEEKTAKSARLNAVFADILDQWAKAGLTK